MTPTTGKARRHRHAVAAALCGAALCACAHTVYFERTSDGAQGECIPSWGERLAGSGPDAALGRCIENHVREGYVRVSDPDGDGSDGGTAALALAAPDGRTRAGPASGPQAAAERERRVQFALLEAQLQSRSRYLDEQLSAAQRSELAPLLRGIVKLALAGAAEREMDPLRRQIGSRIRKLGIGGDTRRELEGMLRDCSRIAELGGSAAAGVPTPAAARRGQAGAPRPR